MIDSWVPNYNASKEHFGDKMRYMISYHYSSRAEIYLGYHDLSVDK